MAQTMLFWAEYAEELSVLLCALVLVLLIVTLHRIKQITKLIQEIAGNTKESGKIANQTERTDKCDVMSATEKEVEDFAAQELLAEVLDEVFP